MDYLFGKEKDFWKFLDSINDEDKIVLFTHNDLDGIVSAIFLEKILKNKDFAVEEIYFLDYKKSLFDSLNSPLKEKGITKVFITDISADSIEGFEKFFSMFDVFLIDHHPINSQFDLRRNALKTETLDCTSLATFYLWRKIYSDEEDILFVCAAMIADMSFNKKENFEFIQKFYPEVNDANLFDSVPGIFCRKVTSALIYYSDNTEMVYTLVKGNKIEELNKADKIISKEIEESILDAERNSDCHSDKKVCFYFLDSKFNIASIVCTRVSVKSPEFTFVFFSLLEDGKTLKVSARNQSGDVDVNILLKNSTKDLENASGGGHAKSAGGAILKKDLEKFKKNILEEI